MVDKAVQVEILSDKLKIGSKTYSSLQNPEPTKKLKYDDFSDNEDSESQEEILDKGNSYQKSPDSSELVEKKI